MITKYKLAVEANNKLLDLPIKRVYNRIASKGRRIDTRVDK